MQRQPEAATKEVCLLCGRPLVPGPSTNEHHLVPKSRRGRETVRLHRICHGAIHAAFTEKQLASYYHSPERLLESPEIRRFVAWVRRKPPEFYVPTRGRRRR